MTALKNIFAPLKNDKIPKVKGLPLIGTVFSIMANGGPQKLHLYVDKRHKQLGPIYREKIGPVSGVFVSDGDFMRKIFSLEGKYPRHIIPESWTIYNRMYERRRGLLFMDGEEWWKFRKTLNNIILKPNNEHLFSSIDFVADELVEKWLQQGKVHHLEKQLYKWSLQVILGVLLGTEDYKKHKPNLNRLVEELSSVIHEIFIESAALSMIPAKLAANFKFPVWKRFVKAADSALELGHRVVQNLLNISPIGSKGLLYKMKESGIQDKDLYRIVIDLILAAGDTTAYSTQWLLYLLSINQEKQNRIFEEIEDVNDKDVVNCSLLKGAIRESLRLYPVAPFITRYMPQNVSIDQYQINQGELILMSLYSSGRNEKYFPEANLFKPERWLRNSTGYQGVTNSNASLPFAMGSRSCIGKKIAEMQILVTISKILKSFRVTSDTKKQVDIVLHLISVPSEPIQLKFEKR